MKYFIRVIVVIVIILAIAVGTQVYGYSSLKTDFSASNVSPEFNTSTESVVTALVSVFQGNLLGAASSFVQGLQVEGILTLKNDSFSPLYLPHMQHKVEINGTKTQGVISTDAMWIAPKTSKTQAFNILIDKTDLPEVVLNILASGGSIDISVESSAVIGGFTITKNSQSRENITNPLSSYTSSSGGSNQTTLSAPSVTSYGFSPSSTVLGNSVTVSITLSGGNAGTYTLRLMKDVDLGVDQLVTSYSINHDGTTTSKNYSFTPPNSGSYHLDLQYNSTTLWSQPNDTSRLKITSPTTPAFSVISYGFSPNPINLGNSVNANISMAGGTAGTYTLGIWKDIPLATDQLITSYNVSHNGNQTAQNFSFTPTTAGSYHLGLVFNGNTLWSQPNDNSRLTVTIPVTTTTTTVAFSVISYGFSPNPITLGSSANGSITITGGSAGTYTLVVLKDISLGADEVVGTYTISHNGATSNKAITFTPGSKGKYYFHIEYGGSTLWSQPNNTTRLTVN